ncbi:MAG: S8 family serine peptidase [Phycisphaerae bacterium]
MRSRFLIGAAICCSTFTGFAQIADTDPFQIGADARKIYLRAATIDTRTLHNAKHATADDLNSSKHYLLQLDGPMTDAIRDKLTATGVHLGAYLPKNAFVITGDTQSLSRAALQQDVVWMGEFVADWKLDPEVGARLAPYATAERQALENDGLLKVVVSLFEDADVAATEMLIAQLGGVLNNSVNLGGQQTIDVTIDPNLLSNLIEMEAVQYIEDAPEITFRNSTDRWIVQSNVPNVFPFYDRNIHGEGQIVGVLDGKLDSNHCSFSDTNPIGPTHRKIVAYNTSLGASSHGTHVSGTIAGDAGIDDDTRGVAYLAKIAYDDIPSFNETSTNTVLEQHHNQGARMHTNSWGDDGTTSYNSLCRGFDVFLYNNEDSMAMLAVTNTGTLRNPENAKNLLACGASQDTPSQGNHCSGGTGPTSDGRRKPEVYAPGCGTRSASPNSGCGTNASTGTSMATPAIAGAGALVRQYFTDGFYPTGIATPGDEMTPTGALVKAMLINSAVDMTGPAGYPSNQEGWGRILADNSAYFDGDSRKLYVEDVRNADGMSTNDTAEFIVNVLDPSEQLRVTVVWTEPAATSGAGFAQVNDLDLVVVSPDGNTYLGNSFAAGQSTTGGSKDDRNNVEQVHVMNPEVGEWTVRINAAGVNVGTQGYSLVATGDITTVLPPLSMSLPNGTPDMVLPDVNTDVTVRVSPGAESVVPGSVVMMYRADGGAFVSLPLTDNGDDLYTATLPGAGCDEIHEYYFEAVGNLGSTRTLPLTAPDSFYATTTGEIVTIFADDFQTDTGWSVDNDAGLTAGAWQRGTPVGGGDRGDPAADYDGSGQCYLTQNQDGDSDVDGGATRLISPTLDLTDQDADIHFAKWYTNNNGGGPNADTMTVEVSNNNGGSWVLVQTFGPVSSAGWTEEVFTVSDFVMPTAQVRVRFAASDFGTGSVVEAGIDAFSIERFQCESTALLGDMNCDGVISVSDIAPFVLALTDPAGYAAQFPDCNIANGDLNHDEMVSVSDIGLFVGLLTGA